MRTLFFAICLFVASFATNVKAQLPPLSACITNVIIYSATGGSIRVGQATNTVIQTSAEGYNFVSSNCSDSDSNVRMTFYLDHCATASTTVATIAWQCDVNRKCNGGTQGALVRCGSGGSVDVKVAKGCDSVSGFILSFGNGCCDLSWCQDSEFHCLLMPAPSQTNNPPPTAE